MKKVHVNSIVLTELPSEVLVHILQYCNGNQILNFSEACGVGQTKIEDVVRNRRLWQKVHIGPGNLRRYMKFLGSYTSDIILEGTLRVGKDTRPLKSSSLDKSEHVPESLLSSISIKEVKLKIFFELFLIFVLEVKARFKDATDVSDG